MSARTRRPSTPAPDPVLADGVGRDVLEALCTPLEAAVRRQKEPRAEEIDAEKPGGARNKDVSARGWLSFLNQLHRWHATGPLQPTKTPRFDAQVHEDQRAALAEEPIHFRISGGRSLAVYPKSEHALHRLQLIDLAIQYFLGPKLALESAPPSKFNLETLRQANASLEALQCEWLWILTHPEASVPWAEDGVWEHAPPAEIVALCRSLTPWDFLAIRQAHLDVNLFRINAISDKTHALANTPAGESMPFSQFLGVMSTEMGIKSSEIARRWSVGLIYAMALTKLEATAAAEAKAKERG